MATLVVDDDCVDPLLARERLRVLMWKASVGKRGLRLAIVL